MPYPLVRRTVASIEYASIRIASYFPSNAIRRLALITFGASVGRGVAIHRGLEVRAARRLVIGDDVWLGVDVVLDARGGIVIGDSTSIGDGVQLLSAGHDWNDEDFRYTTAAVGVGDHCWINTRSVLLPGAEAENGTVVAAGAVVHGTIGPFALYGGVPARFIASRSQEVSYKLNASASKLFWR